MSAHTHDWKPYGPNATACYGCKTISFDGGFGHLWGSEPPGFKWDANHFYISKLSEPDAWEDPAEDELDDAKEYGWGCNTDGCKVRLKTYPEMDAHFKSTGLTHASAMSIRWERDDAVRGVPESCGEERAMEEKPARQESNCYQCSRPNDVGSAKCWWCSAPNPAPIATTDDPDWSSSLMKALADIGPRVAAATAPSTQGMHLPPIPFAGGYAQGLPKAHNPANMHKSLTLSPLEQGALISSILDKASQLAEYAQGSDWDEVLDKIGRATDLIRQVK